MWLFIGINGHFQQFVQQTHIYQTYHKSNTWTYIRNGQGQVKPTLMKVSGNFRNNAFQNGQQGGSYYWYRNCSLFYMTYVKCSLPVFREVCVTQSLVFRDLVLWNIGCVFVCFFLLVIILPFLRFKASENRLGILKYFNNSRNISSKWLPNYYCFTRKFILYLRLNIST